MDTTKLTHYLKRVGVLLLASVWLAGACSPGADEPEVPEAGLVVVGSVLDRIEGEGLSGVEIYLRGDGGEEMWIAITGDDGLYASEPLWIEPGVDLEIRAVASGRSFHPEAVKARMEVEADLWVLDFIHAWPVSMWARVAERVFVEREASGGVFSARVDPSREAGGGTPMEDVPFFYSVDGGSRSLLGYSNHDGELFPGPVWLPIGAKAAFWPEMDGFQFAPASCTWLHERPIDSIGVTFIAEPAGQPMQSLQVACERVP